MYIMLLFLLKIKQDFRYYRYVVAVSFIGEKKWSIGTHIPPPPTQIANKIIFIGSIKKTGVSGEIPQPPHIAKKCIFIGRKHLSIYRKLPIHHKSFLSLNCSLIILTTLA